MQALEPYQRRVVYLFTVVILAGLFLKVVDRERQAISFDISGFLDGYTHSKTISADSIAIDISTQVFNDAESSVSALSASFHIDINTADIYQLQALPGIGPQIAENIVAFRRDHGPFRSSEDLLKVKGIGRQKLQEIKKYINFENTGD